MRLNLCCIERWKNRTPVCSDCLRRREEAAGFDWLNFCRLAEMQCWQPVWTERTWLAGVEVYISQRGGVGREGAEKEEQGKRERTYFENNKNDHNNVFSHRGSRPVVVAMRASALSQ